MVNILTQKFQVERSNICSICLLKEIKNFEYIPLSSVSAHFLKSIPGKPEVIIAKFPTLTSGGST